uniref:Uncharacterized protein n=1 Tax=Tanacetum cinerariifolium TaxID=118510 RepID=A0A6L2K6A2_TANCI|nr:hypothetical protein [Tanacetum cinerariifolium]
MYCIDSSNKAAILKVRKDYVRICLERLNDGTAEVRDAAFSVLVAIEKTNFRKILHQKSDGRQSNYDEIAPRYNQFQKSSPAWCAADYFERFSPELRMAEVRPYQEWVISHTCTTCGVLDYWCRCKRWARLQNMELPQCVVPIDGCSTKFGCFR